MVSSLKELMDEPELRHSAIALCLPLLLVKCNPLPIIKIRGKESDYSSRLFSLLPIPYCLPEGLDQVSSNNRSPRCNL